VADLTGRFLLAAVVSGATCCCPAGETDDPPAEPAASVVTVPPSPLVLAVGLPPWSGLGDAAPPRIVPMLALGVPAGVQPAGVEPAAETLTAADASAAEEVPLVKGDPRPHITAVSTHIEQVMSRLDRIVEESFQLQRALLNLRLGRTHTPPPPTVYGPSTATDD